MKRTILYLISLMMIYSASASAFSVCTDRYLNCDPGVGQNVDCLERYYACGRFKEAISLLGAQSLSPEQKYLRGASFFALYAKTRAHSLKCEYLFRARQDLQSYLNENRDRLFDGDVFIDGKNMAYLYNAVQLLQNAEQMELETQSKACEDSSLTLAQVDLFVKQYIDERIEDFFLGTGKNDALKVDADEQMRDFTRAMGVKIAATVDVENKLRLGIAEVESLKSHQQKLRIILGENGPLSQAAIAALASTWGDYQTEYQFMTKIRERIYKAFPGTHPQGEGESGNSHGMTPEDYENARDEWLERADDMNSQATWAINVMNEGNVLAHTALEDIEKAYETVEDIYQMSSSLNGMKADWKEHGILDCNWPVKPWWCSATAGK